MDIEEHHAPIGANIIMTLLYDSTNARYQKFRISGTDRGAQSRCRHGEHDAERQEDT